MTDPDTTKAVEALAHRLRSWDRDDTDAEVFALEFMTALLGQGWRMTQAKAPVAWEPVPVTPGAYERGGALARERLLNRHGSSDEGSAA
jgi:hypothetical protein